MMNRKGKENSMGRLLGILAVLGGIFQLFISFSGTVNPITTNLFLVSGIIWVSIGIIAMVFSKRS